MTSRTSRVVLMATALILSAAPALAASMVTIKNFAFSPMNLTVSAGTTVTWKNLDGEPHTVTSVDGTFRSGALDQNDSYSFKFTGTGTYKYLCSIHPMMTGTVVVQ